MEEPAQAVRALEGVSDILVALEGVSDMPGELGCARQAPKLGFDPGPQGLDDRRREFLSDLATPDKPPRAPARDGRAPWPLSGTAPRCVVGRVSPRTRATPCRAGTPQTVSASGPNSMRDPMGWRPVPDRRARRTLCSHRHAAGRRRHSRSVPTAGGRKIHDLASAASPTSSPSSPPDDPSAVPSPSANPPSGQDTRESDHADFVQGRLRQRAAKPVLRWMAAHHGLYPGQRRDASEYLLAHGRRRAALELHKPSPPVDPTVCDIPWVGDPSRIAERVVHCVAIDMQRVAAETGLRLREWWNSTIGGSGPPWPR